MAFFGDAKANIYGVAADTGYLFWKTKADAFPVAGITGSPVFHNGRIYIGIRSGEEAAGADPKYECCRFRGSVVVDPAVVDSHLIFGALIGAISWNVITWYYGLPSSSSHALIGGLVGSTIAKAGTGPLLAPGIIKTASFIVVAPLLGMLLSGIIIVALSWICRRRTQRQTDRWFRKLQLVSSAMYSIGHGSNDAQKTMGIIWLLLISAHLTSPDHLPNWVVISCYVAIALGTLFGGWRIVKTMGQRITKLKPIGGFAAETGGAISLFMATYFGIPVSTTHTITGSIIGVGSAQRVRAVR